MFTFLAENKKAPYRDVRVNLQDIPSLGPDSERKHESNISLTDTKQMSSVATGKVEAISSFQSRYFTSRTKPSIRDKIRLREINIASKKEWTQYSCKPDTDNIWRKFLRDIGHEYIPSPKHSDIMTPKVNLEPEEFPSSAEYEGEGQMEEGFIVEEERSTMERDSPSLCTREMMHARSLEMEDFQQKSEEDVSRQTKRKRYAEWMTTFHPPVSGRPLYIYSITGSSYFGQWSDLNMHGNGSYILPLGTRYSGQLKDGTFYGQGVLYYPYGSRIEGEWINGKLNPKKRKYIFWDGLEFKEHNWEYLRGYDHRFHSEVTYGLRPGCEFKRTNSGVEHCIPIGWYDVAEGYFNPHTKAVMSYDTEEFILGDGSTRNIHKLLRITSREEMNWIIKNCRKEEDKVIGFQKDLFEFLYEDQHVPLVAETDELDEVGKIIGLKEFEEQKLPVSETIEIQSLENVDRSRIMFMQGASETQEDTTYETCVQILVENKEIRKILLSRDEIKQREPTSTSASKTFSSQLQKSADL